MRAAGHDLAVVGSRSLTRAQAFAAAHGARRARGSYEDVIAADDVDAVYIALPNDLHEPWAVAALQAGKHVLCEKPLGLDAAAAARIAAAAASSGRLVMEAVMTRFHPRTAALLDLVGSGAVGDLRTVTATFSFTLDRPDDYRHQVRHGGGALLDVGIYGVAMSRWLTAEEPVEVRALQRVVSPVAAVGESAGRADAATSALLQFGSGTIAAVHAGFDTAEVQLVEILGSAGTLTVPRAFSGAADVPLLRDGEVIGTWSADPYERMVTAFAEAVAAGARSAPLPVDDAIATATVLDRIAEAGRA